jgi:tetratricopeptide (TPR) repeat protein
LNTYAPGSLINDRYEVASRPLMGAMGIVYLCVDHNEDRPIALKTFQSKFLPNREARDRFLREGTAWIELGSHPHIVRCYGVERIETGNEIFLVLEQVVKEQRRDDPSLRSWLQTGHSLPIDQALLFALQIARGMRHATTKIPGFVHRDLKPENVLVGADYITGTKVNRLRVTDFGLASVLNTDLALNLDKQTQNADFMKRTQLTHGIVGTPLYMSPEQWKGEHVSVATDIYALGCILYEMIIGQFAVTADSIKELERKHCDGKISPVKVVLSPDVARLLITCLAPNPANRYTDWGKVVAALENAYQNVTHKTVPAEETSNDLTRVEQLAVGLGYADLGGSYMDIGKIETALPYFEKAISIARLQKNENLEAAALNSLGMSYLYLGDLDQGIKHCKQALGISQKIGDKCQEAAVLMNLGTAYKNSGNIQLAIEHHEKSLKVNREIGDQHGEGNTLIALGIAYKNLRNIERAIEYYKKALEISHKISDRRMEGVVLTNMGIAFKNMNTTKDAIDCFERAITIAREIGNRIGEGTGLGNLGNTYLQMGDAQKAVPFFMQSIEIEKETGGRRGEGIQTMNLGRAYTVLGDSKQAIGFLEQSMVIFEEVGDLYNRADSMYLTAVILAESEDISRATLLAKESLRIWTQIGSPSIKEAKELLAELNRIAKENKPAFWSRLFSKKDNHRNYDSEHKKKNKLMYELLKDGSNCFRKGKAEQSIEIFNKALIISNELDDNVGKIRILGWLGVVYLETDQAQRSMEYLNEALMLSRDVGNMQEESGNLVNLGKAYQNLGDMQHAVDCYKKAIVIYREMGNKNQEGILLEVIGNVYSAIDDMSHAIECWEKALVISKGINDFEGVASMSANLALKKYAYNGDFDRAFSLIKEAVQIWTKTSSPNAQIAQTRMVFIGAYSLTRTEDTTSKKFFSVMISEFTSIFGSDVNLFLERFTATTVKGDFINVVEQTIKAKSSDRESQILSRQVKTLKQIMFDLAIESGQAFMQSNSLSDMQDVVKNYPLLGLNEFINTIERIIEKQVQTLDKNAYKSRLSWLKQVATASRKST